MTEYKHKTLYSAKRIISIALALLLLTLLATDFQIVTSEDGSRATARPATVRSTFSAYLSLISNSVRPIETPEPTEPPATVEPGSLPIQGLYDSCVAYVPDCINHLDLFAAKGFRVVLNYGTLYDRSASLLGYADRAQSLGMKIIWDTGYRTEMGNDPAHVTKEYPDLTRESGCKDNTCLIRYVVNLVKNHPATWGYYVADEIDPSEHDKMKTYSDLVKATDPNHPRLFVVAGSYEMEQYYHFPSFMADLADVMGPDIYPYGYIVPGDEESDITGIVADHTQYWANKMGLKGAVVLQAYDGGRYDCFSFPCTFPTYEQMKAQRDQVIQNMQPELILWWTFDDILNEQEDWQKHWNDLSNAAFAPAQADLYETEPGPRAPCPSGWICEDIGNPNVSGSQAFSEEAWVVEGAGWNIASEHDVLADQFHYVWQTSEGDQSLGTQIISQTSQNTRAKGGLMFRKTYDPTSPFYAAFLTSNGMIKVHYRKDFLKNTYEAATKRPSSLPVTIRISRVGNTFSAYTSEDGVVWVLIPGSTITIAKLEGPLMGGLAVTSGDKNVINSMTFSDYSSNP